MTIIDELTKKKWAADQVLLLAGFLLFAMFLWANERKEERYNRCMEMAARYTVASQLIDGCTQPSPDVAHRLCSEASGY